MVRRKVLQWKDVKWLGKEKVNMFPPKLFRFQSIIVARRSGSTGKCWRRVEAWQQFRFTAACVCFASETYVEALESHHMAMRCRFRGAFIVRQLGFVFHGSATAVKKGQKSNLKRWLKVHATYATSLAWYELLLEFNWPVKEEDMLSGAKTQFEETKQVFTACCA